MLHLRESHPVLPNGKFFSRRGERFFLKAIRLVTANVSLGFEENIALYKRLGDLYAAHTTAVVIADGEVEAALDLVAQRGLYALLELKVRPEDLLSRKALHRAICKLRERLASLRGYPSLLGYLLDCPVEPDMLRSCGLDMLRARLARIVASIRDIDADKMVGLKHRTCTVGLTLHDEDFVYAVIPPLGPDKLRSSVIRLHNLAEARPVVLKFSRGTA